MYKAAHPPVCQRNRADMVIAGSGQGGGGKGVGGEGREGGKDGEGERERYWVRE